MPASSLPSEKVSDAIVSEAMHVVSRRILPFMQAAETGYQRFLNQSLDPERVPFVEQAEAPIFRSGRELVTEQIPLREFALKRGKITGESSLGDKSLSTEIAITSVRLKRHDTNVLQILWKDPEREGSETVCKIGPSLGSDNTVKHLLSLIHTGTGLEVSVQVDYQPGYRDITVSFPMCQVLERIPEVEREFLHEAKRICEERQIVYSATQRVSLSQPPLFARSEGMTQMAMPSDAHEAIEEAMQIYLSQQRDAWLSQTQSVYSNCRNLLESRKLAMEEERSFRYSKWNDTIKAMEGTLNSLSNHSRSAISRDSNLVR